MDFRSLIVFEQWLKEQTVIFLFPLHGEDFVKKLSIWRYLNKGHILMHQYYQTLAASHGMMNSRDHAWVHFNENFSLPEFHSG